MNRDYILLVVPYEKKVFVLLFLALNSWNHSKKKKKKNFKQNKQIKKTLKHNFFYFKSYWEATFDYVFIHESWFRLCIFIKFIPDYVYFENVFFFFNLFEYVKRYILLNCHIYVFSNNVQFVIFNTFERTKPGLIITEN